MSDNIHSGPLLIVVIAPEAVPFDFKSLDLAEDAGMRLFHTVKDYYFACDECEAGWCRGYACIHGEGFGRLEPHLREAARLLVYVPVRWEGALPMLGRLVKTLKAFQSPVNRIALSIRESGIVLSDEFSENESDEFRAMHRGLCEAMRWASC